MAMSTDDDIIFWLRHTARANFLFDAVREVEIIHDGQSVFKSYMDKVRISTFKLCAPLDKL